MRRVPLLLALLLLFAACEAGLDAPAEMTLRTTRAVEVLPADAQMVAMVDFQDMKRNNAVSPFGPGRFDVQSMSEEVAARLQDFIAATGFDPERDLREVYVASDLGSANHEASLVVYADYDRARLDRYVADNLEAEMTRSEHAGIPVYHAADNGDGHGVYFALANDNMMLASGDQARLHAMLDRLQDRSTALEDDAAMMALIEQVGSGSAWFALRGMPDFVTPEAGDDEFGRLAGTVGHMAGTVSVTAEGLDGRMVMSPLDGVSADDMADLARGVVAAMRFGSEQDAAKMQALDEVRVRTAGDQVRVSFSFDNALLSTSN